MSDEGVIVGIDLGTTYSLVASLQDRTPVVLPNAVGELLTPSAVSIAPDGTTLVGAAALARAVTDPDATATLFKRDMGTDRTWQLSERSFRAEQLSALVLQSLKQDAEAALGMKVKEAVVTVPAYFGELQRRATRDACELAGLHCERIINEPTAAAIAYGLHDTEQEQRAVVLDLGGGTFDVTVLEIIEGVIEIQATSGDTQLGGEDFAEALNAHVLEQIRAEYGELSGLQGKALLLQACERAKRQLSSHDSARLAVAQLPLKRGKRDIELPLRRAEVEALWEPLLARIKAPIRRALRDASAEAADIDAVLLVGGATRMPCIAELAAKLFGRLPLRSLPPDEAVVMGAAVQGALKHGHSAVDDIVVTDIAPFSMGVESANKLGNHIVGGLFSPIIERGTVLPVSRSSTFSTLGDNQREILLKIYQGEHSLCADNQQLGELSIHPLPRGKAGEQSVEVRFTYDLNGILEVDAKVLSTGKAFSLLIEKSPGLLSPDALDKARAAMQRLKFHPREALPNVTALERAETLYMELTGLEREMLGGAMTELRLALDAQDAALIVEGRESLNALVAALRSKKS